MTGNSRLIILNETPPLRLDVHHSPEEAAGAVSTTIGDDHRRLEIVAAVGNEQQGGRGLVQGRSGRRRLDACLSRSRVFQCREALTTCPHG
jgi:hypothetical protein